MDQYKYLDDLNAAQREAVEYIDGPSLVIAGAGSGKTRVITYKIVHLLRLGVEPWRILALTFTNKAAREMESRVASMTGPEVAARLWMGTFHSIFLRILRRHAELVGFKPGFTIYDANDSKSLVKMIVKDLGLDDKAYKTATIAGVISKAKNAMMSPEQYINEYADADKKSKRPMTGRIYQIYSARCRAANAMDFDDILVYTNLLLRDNPDIAAKYRDNFRYILVDEYQDTNFAQHMVVKQLTGNPARLCVVGDDAQSIYSFRGANIGNIINLEKVYPGIRTFKLEQNYRSTRNIVAAAGSLIEKNTRQIPKQVFSKNEQGSKIDVIRTYSDLEEAYTVAASIESSKLSEHDSYDDYAILYRTNAQSRVLEESLRKRNISYRLVGGTAFYQRKEIKDVIGYFRMAINPTDDEALRRVINYPARGIGETTVTKLHHAAAENGVSIWEVVCNPTRYGLSVNSGTLRKLEGFRIMIEAFINDSLKSNAYELGQLIFNRTGILTALAHDNTPESISRQENLQELLTGLKDFTDQRLESGEEDLSMVAFLSEVMLATDADEKDKVDGPKVTMMTVHAAKGLEFKHVYIVGVEEELFHSALSMDSLAEVEEERRLMYVAITRAEKSCVITYAQSRFRNGQTKMTNPSRFLRDIDPQYLNYASDSTSHSASGSSYTSSSASFINPVENYRRSYGAAKSYGRKMVPVAQTGSGAAPQHTRSELEIGMQIEHVKLGKGTITALGSVSGEDSITVDFGVMGSKKLLLKFAKFRIL
jgi:DNA helicase-2/ATP-dependent DNA helicase PcrA